ncbi:MAG: hypothetical protein HY911_04820 [Desulfobacterales bacterium]|nr:hypothetical protein [Desulfobacterales bacterium]
MKSKPGSYGIESALTFSSLHPGYCKTLSNLRSVVHPEVALEGGVLRFTSYPFEPAAVFPYGAVGVDPIAEVNLGYPSQVRLKDGDILFVPQQGKEALITFINQNDVRVERRISIWDALLEPFLDTWVDQETIDRQFAWFERIGLVRNAVDAWRREVAVAMMAYNFGTNLWEWVQLGLYDVLIAQRARLSGEAFADFYRRAVRQAAGDPVAQGLDAANENTIESVLFSVLLDWYPRKSTKSPKEFRKQSDLRSEQIHQLQRKLAAELTAAYSESHRRYHTVSHIEKCLTELNQAWAYAIRLNEIRWAILFHDAVYDPRRSDNEALSADWACRVMDELHRSDEEKARVRAMILATAHANEPTISDEALLVDIDLSILGADESAFDAYDRAVRAEFEWVPEDIYRRARADVLSSFLGRARLYLTAEYRRILELPARKNIARALVCLRRE